MQTEKSSASVFQEACAQYFRFLQSDYAFRIIQNDGWLFDAKSDNCRIKVYNDRFQIFLTVGPGDAIRLRPDSSKELAVTFILQHLAPHVGYRARSYEKPQQIPDEVKKLADLLLEYCLPMLKGDFSQWQAFEEYAEADTQAWLMESRKRVAMAALQAIREKAELALASHEYGIARLHYESIRDSLTPLEERRLEYLRKKLTKN